MNRKAVLVLILPEPMGQKTETREGPGEQGLSLQHPHLLFLKKMSMYYFVVVIISSTDHSYWSRDFIGNSVIKKHKKSRTDASVRLTMLPARKI